MAETGGAPSLPAKVVAIERGLSRAKVPHAIGGALALAYYAEPRATVDVDVNVFLSTAGWTKVAGALAPLGVDVNADVKALERDGQVRLWWDRNPVDLFFSYDPFHEAMERATRRVPFAGTTITILAPEHLVICKAMFDRPKDWLDIEAILVATDPLDIGSILDWLRRMVGTESERMARFAGLLAGLEIPIE